MFNDNYKNQNSTNLKQPKDDLNKNYHLHIRKTHHRYTHMNVDERK